MRDGTPIILWLLIISFGLLWVLSDVNFFDAVTAGPRSLGSVNGEPISLEDYNARIQYYSNAYTQQTGGAVTAEQRAFYESQAWEELVNTRLLEQKMDEIGITVTDQELIDMVTGPNPDPFIRQYFEQEDGTINQAALQQALAADENSDIWIMIEDQLRQNRRQQKLNNFITAGLQISDEEIHDRYLANNTTVDVRFIRFPFADVKSEDIEITEDELRAYHRANSEDYKRDESYRFNFVTFSILPTAQDTLRIRDQVEGLRDRFAAADNDSLFLLRNGSTSPYSVTTVAASDIREDYQPVTQLNTGEVTDLIQTGGRVTVLKKTGQSVGEVSFVTFSLDIVADPFTTVDQQFEEADDFLYYAQESGSLEEEADQRGMVVRNGFTTKGNPFIPGLGSSQQILNFLERADKNEFSEVLELQNDFAVVQLIEVEPEGIRPLDDVRAQVENSVRIEKRREIMTERVETLLQGISTLEQLAQKSAREIQEVTNLKMNSNVLRGAGREPGVIGRLFTLEADNMSGAIEGETGIYVAVVSNKQEADISLMDQTTKEQLRQQILQQKNTAYLAVWLEELKDEATIKDNRARLLR